jgi:hypothetical protein
VQRPAAALADQLGELHAEAALEDRYGLPTHTQ